MDGMHRVQLIRCLNDCITGGGILYSRRRGITDARPCNPAATLCGFWRSTAWLASAAASLKQVVRSQCVCSLKCFQLIACPIEDRPAALQIKTTGLIVAKGFGKAGW